MKKMLLIALIALVLPAVSAGAVGVSGVVEITTNGGVFRCAMWDGYEAFPFGMYDSAQPESPEFQLPCNMEYPATRVIIDNIVVYDSPEPTTVNPHKLLMQ